MIKSQRVNQSLRRKRRNLRNQKNPNKLRAIKLTKQTRSLRNQLTRDPKNQSIRNQNSIRNLKYPSLLTMASLSLTFPCLSHSYLTLRLNRLINRKNVFILGYAHTIISKIFIFVRCVNKLPAKIVLFMAPITTKCIGYPN